MKLTLAEYRNKVRGCWMGKNIGGTLGAPFECRRGVFDVTFYTQDLKGEALPNDDLDLQLVWLNAVEKHGRNVSATILGEYWLSHITPNWAEYGASKNNLRNGLLPPLSGYVGNEYRDSNGAFIRSEIWACLAAGHPDIAVQYAYEDAIVDHSHEGVYAEVLFAAIQSAAFVESDPYRLIDIGLSYIPEDSGVARGVKSAINAYQSGLSWQEARIQVLTDVPGSFGFLGTPPETLTGDIPNGPIGWDAPGNAGITIIGWLYGEGDFGESLCIATNCGEDTDCTAATLGAILGIIAGEQAIPQRWVDPIGDKINTWCINFCDRGISLPQTVGELTERILMQTPLFLGPEICDFIHSDSGYTLELLEGDKLSNHGQRVNCWVYNEMKDLVSQSPFVVHHDFNIFSTYLDYHDEPYIQAGIPRALTLTIDNQIFMQQWLDIRWHLPAGWTVSPGARIGSQLEQYHCNIGKTIIEFVLTPVELLQSRYDLVLEITSQGRPTKGFVPVVLINGTAAKKN
ncbi:hypothetical protein Back11_63100 [Paenibacillus baekrokdamisoli]|uniref:Uncharacterized protein n=1 Tax=Paenibacillus baekrokdamisoli TaxID=1712516 RepID=A0A3G9J9D8_9BACL|nr:ADP-ribosylglycohydrolase family protein [Paenibacillus baekrokdamisoli]MBB3069462.1 ADP-ribosylglycohydrolase [Paenibacillus baekrokdamisoli]BBH24965.1 hypothetical protein Back11_63100 [Paenibacillus baekrokdamisoli]